jgi:hypothetical protein
MVQTYGESIFSPELSNLLTWLDLDLQYRKSPYPFWLPGTPVRLPSVHGFKLGV